MSATKMFLIFSVTLFLVSCGFTSNPEPSIEGTWKLVTGKYVNVDTVVEYPLTEVADHMKIISGTHFATVWQDSRESDWVSCGYNGGTYTLQNGVYAETHPFFSIETRRQNTEYFTVTITTDRLFMVPCNVDGTPNKFGNYEEWVRLK